MTAREGGPPDAGPLDAAGSLPPSPETATRRQLWLVGARLAIATLLLGGALAIHRLRAVEGRTTEDAILLLIALTFATALGVAVMIPRMRRPALWASLQVGWDLVLVTALVYLLGGAVSGFAFLYGVVILGAALSVGPRAASFTTAASLIAYVTVGLGLANGWLSGLPDAELVVVPDEELGLAMLRTVVGLLLVGLLAGGLAERLRRTGGELRAAEASVAEISRLNEDILRSLGSGLAIVAPDGRISRINPAGASLLGGDPEALADQPISALLPVDGHETRGEGEARRPDGSTFPVGFSCSPLRDSADRVQGTLVLFQDLTELRRLRDKAARAERLAALGRLSAGLAHEIRNPLGSISGSVEMVREAPELADDDRRLLTLVLGEVDRLNDLVTTMLDVGRPREPQRGLVDLAALAAGVCKVFRARTEVAVDVSLPEAPVHVWADPGQLRQVLWNLVKNAQQFTPPGGRVRVVVDEDEDGAARLAVSDQGPGLEAEEVERVFEVFYSTRHHGVGLGLALVRQIVEAHGGRVEVRSEIGEGATFRVVLPHREARPSGVEPEHGREEDIDREEHRALEPM